MSKEAEIEIQTIDGKDYKVIEGTNSVFECFNYCAFTIGSQKCRKAKCLAYKRKDGRDVYLVEIKQ